MRNRHWCPDLERHDIEMRWQLRISRHRDRDFTLSVITSQLPVEHWHAYLNDPTLADAILDRVLHAAHKLPLAGESQRKPEKTPSLRSELRHRATDFTPS